MTKGSCGCLRWRGRSNKLGLVATPRFPKRATGYESPLSNIPLNEHLHHLTYQIHTFVNLQTYFKMPERRVAASSSSTHSRSTGVRRNLFHQHLSRRPTTSSTSTSAETLRLDNDLEVDSSDIVIRDQNGDFQIGDPPFQAYDDQEDGGNGDVIEDESTIYISGILELGLALINNRGETEIGRCREASPEG